MNRMLPALLLCFAVLVLPGRASAQTRPDSAAVLLDAARRFEAQGRTEVADALMEMILERYGDTPAAAEVRRLRTELPAGRGVRSGAVELQVWSTLYGFWLGVATPLITSADGPEPYGLGLLVGGPTGFLLSRSYARSRSLSDGQARAITWGGTWGSWQGFGWAQVLDWGREVSEVCPDPGQCFEVEEGDNVEEVVASMVVGGLTGIVAGALISQKPIAAGLATTVNFGSLWGSWFGVATAVLMDLEDDDLLAATLAGGNAGLVATAVLGPGWQLSRNRARLISIAGVVGGLGGAGFDLLLQVDDEKTAVLIPLASSIAGLVVGALTTRDYDAGATGGGDEDAAGALLRVDGGRLLLGTPHPMPTLLRADGGPGRRWHPAIAVPLLSARF
jgi:hypothetical protein